MYCAADAGQTPQKKRLDSLEATNARLTQQVAHLEAEAATSAAALRERSEQASAAAERAAAAEAEVASLQAEVESHEKQIALLEVNLIWHGRQYAQHSEPIMTNQGRYFNAHHACLAKGNSTSP